MFKDGSDKKYCYPNSNTLINLYDVKDNDKLKVIDGIITGKNITILHTTNCVKGEFDFEHFKAIHKFIFKDLYPFAGEIRSVDISKGSVFCLSQHIDAFAKDIFKGLQKDDYFMGLNKDQYIEKMADLMGDLNALHPFREGNGRAQRAFIKLLGEATGYNINFASVTKEQMINASIKSFNGDNTELKKMFNSITTRCRKVEQLQAINSLCHKDGPVTKSFTLHDGTSIKGKINKAKDQVNLQEHKELGKSKNMDR